MNKKERESLKGLSTKEKLFAIINSELTDLQIDEQSVINGTPIMDCAFDELGLDSLSFFNIGYECQDVFKIREDISIKMSETVGKLWSIIQEYGKGEN